jgi:hypothetical protein
MMQPYGNSGEREEFGLLLPAMLPRAQHDHHLGMITIVWND